MIDTSGFGYLCLDDVMDAVQGFFCTVQPNYYNNVFGPLSRWTECTE